MSFIDQDSVVSLAAGEQGTVSHQIRELRQAVDNELHFN